MKKIFNTLLITSSLAISLTSFANATTVYWGIPKHDTNNAMNNASDTVEKVHIPSSGSIYFTNGANHPGEIQYNFNTTISVSVEHELNTAGLPVDDSVNIYAGHDSDYWMLQPDYNNITNTQVNFSQLDPTYTYAIIFADWDGARIDSSSSYSVLEGNLYSNFQGNSFVLADSTYTQGDDYIVLEFTGVSELNFDVTDFGGNLIDSGVVGIGVISVPEPSSVLLISLGALGLTFSRRR